jgi:hypothetical protein
VAIRTYRSVLSFARTAHQISAEYTFNVPLPVTARRPAYAVAEAGSHVPLPVGAWRPASIVAEAERPMPTAFVRAGDVSTIFMFAETFMFTETTKTIMSRTQPCHHPPLISIHKEGLEAASYMEAAHASVEAGTSPSQGFGPGEDNSGEANSNDGYDCSGSH